MTNPVVSFPSIQGLIFSPFSHVVASATKCEKGEAIRPCYICEYSLLCFYKNQQLNVFWRVKKDSKKTAKNGLFWG